MALIVGYACAEYAIPTGIRAYQRGFAACAQMMMVVDQIIQIVLKDEVDKVSLKVFKHSVSLFP